MGNVHSQNIYFVSRKYYRTQSVPKCWSCLTHISHKPRIYEDENSQAGKMTPDKADDEDSDVAVVVRYTTQVCYVRNTPYTTSTSYICINDNQFNFCLMCECLRFELLSFQNLNRSNLSLSRKHFHQKQQENIFMIGIQITKAKKSTIKINQRNQIFTKSKCILGRVLRKTTKFL